MTGRAGLASLALLAACNHVSVSGSFDMAPDLSTACNDPLSLTACPSGEKCDLVHNTMLTCVTAGSVAPGASCRYVEDCAASTTCSSGSATGTSPDIHICRPFCRQTSDCAPGGLCGNPNLGVSGTVLKLCTIPCDPFNAVSGCSTDTTCRPFSTGLATETELSTDCGAVGAAAEGEACADVGACGDHLYCLRTGSSGLCRTVCELGGTPCAVGQLCSPLLFANMSKTSTKYGICCPSGSSTC